MSEPLRFKPVNPAHEMVYSADGGWVSWEDYARLKAEVERLTLENSQYEEHHKYGQNVITSLREEVERLTKAGWQPMETAPFNRNIRIIVDRNDEGEVGIIWSSDVQHYSVEQYPDWWMPLPVAPAKEGKPHA